ncbi:MAG TPA: class I SAM-dependent methyltransferase [Lentimicrobium sp.]|nr:class I SAM-dependent methyltransferase [Lentimicrobium sp.]
MDDLFEKQQYATTNREYEKYAMEYSMQDDLLLTELVRRTHLSFTTSSMLSGPLQGKLLQFFCRMMNARRVLEIGTYTGYSSIYMARGMAEGGVLHTIDNNREVEDIAEEFIARAGLSGKIRTYQGDALEVIRERIFPFEDELDLVFIDADKENYINYYELCLPRVKKGGFLIADNVLWYGRIFSPEHYKDKETAGILAFNNHVREDKRVEHLLLPVRDGLMVMRKL